MISFSGRPNHILSDLRSLKKSGMNTTGGNMVLNKDFKEFIGLLTGNNVKYLIVGDMLLASTDIPDTQKILIYGF